MSVLTSQPPPLLTLGKGLATSGFLTGVALRLPTDKEVEGKEGDYGDWSPPWIGLPASQVRDEQGAGGGGAASGAGAPSPAPTPSASWCL